MRDLASIMEEILRKEPGINREKLLLLIREKKDKIGSGYLTDTGAAYLVAADLGLTLDFELPSGLGVKDLYIGANAVNLSCRICSVSELKSYKKRDGTGGSLISLIVFDKTGFIRCNLWDSKAEEAQGMDLKSGDGILVGKAYVRSDFNNSPSLHVGQKGTIEKIDDKDLLLKLPTLNDVSIPLDDFTPQPGLFCLKAIVNSLSTTSSFSRKDGSQGNVESFFVRGLRKDIKNRIVLWLSLNATKNIPPIESLVVICPLKVKPQMTGDIEFHGDEKTIIFQLAEESSSYSQKKMIKSSLRLLSIGIPQKTKKGSNSLSALVQNEDGKNLSLMGLNDVVPFLLSMKIGDVVEGTFTFLDRDKLLCTDVNKISKKIKTSPFDASNLYQKISDIKSTANEDKRFFLKAVAISQTTQREVTSRNGEKIGLSELLIGDETDEINLIAWRNLAQMVDKITPGERLIINGVLLKIKPTFALEIKSFSSIIKVTE
jgi:replication factor A1